MIRKRMPTMREVEKLNGRYKALREAEAPFGRDEKFTHLRDAVGWFASNSEHLLII